MTDALVEEVARAIGESQLWPGAWERMPEAERNVHRHAAQAALAIARPAIEREVREACAKVADRQAAIFAEPSYACGPIGAFNEIFACNMIAAAIRKGEA